MLCSNERKKTTLNAMKGKHFSSVSSLEEVLLRPSVQSGKPRSRIAHFKDWTVFFLGPELGKNGGGGEGLPLDSLTRFGLIGALGACEYLLCNTHPKQL